MGRYPANDLIPRRLVPRRRAFGTGSMPTSCVAGDYPRFLAAIPNRGDDCRRLTHPYATGLAARPTCMPNPRRQRSFLARIKPFKMRSRARKPAPFLKGLRISDLVAADSRTRANPPHDRARCRIRENRPRPRPTPPRQAGRPGASRAVLRRLPSKVPGPHGTGANPLVFFTSDRIVKERVPPTQLAGASFRGSRHRPAYLITPSGSERFAA